MSNPNSSQPPAADITLTAFEGKILQQTAKGMSYVSIGNELGTSEDHVKGHARRAFKKLGAVDRPHAVALGYQHGLISAETSESPLELSKPQLLEVLVGMSEGKSNKEIGARFGLSEEAVKSRATLLFKELNVRDRAGAVGEGFRRGILKQAERQPAIAELAGHSFLTRADRKYLEARAVSGSASEAAQRAGIGTSQLRSTQKRLADRYGTNNITKQLVGAWKEKAIKLDIAVPRGRPSSNALAAMAAVAMSVDTARGLDELDVHEDESGNLIKEAAEDMRLPTDSRQEVVLSALMSGMLNPYLPMQDRVPARAPWPMHNTLAPAPMAL